MQVGKQHLPKFVHGEAASLKLMAQARSGVGKQQVNGTFHPHADVKAGAQRQRHFLFQLQFFRQILTPFLYCVLARGLNAVHQMFGVAGGLELLDQLFEIRLVGFFFFDVLQQRRIFGL